MFTLTESSVVPVAAGVLGIDRGDAAHPLAAETPYTRIQAKKERRPESQNVS